MTVDFFKVLLITCNHFCGRFVFHYQLALQKNRMVKTEHDVILICFCWRLNADASRHKTQTNDEMVRRASTKKHSSATKNRAEPVVPAILYVSGCSLHLAGFNGEYYAIINDEGEIRWWRPVHTFLGFTMRSTILTFDDQRNVWLLRSNDFLDYEFYYTPGRYNVPPIGSWTNGGISVSVADPGIWIHAHAVIQLVFLAALVFVLLAVGRKAFLGS